MSDRRTLPGRFTRLTYLVPMLLLAALFSVAIARVTRPVTFHGTAYEPPEPAHDLRLTDHTGRQVRLSDHRGRVVLLFFGYTQCPDVCPLTLGKLRRVLDSLGAGPDEASVLLVTVDPQRDTPQALAPYVERFGPRVTGLTGTPEQLAEVYKAYHVFAAPRPTAPAATHGAHTAHGAGTMVGHTDAVFGIDRHGQIRVLIRPDNPDEVVAEDIRTLLRI